MIQEMKAIKTKLIDCVQRQMERDLKDVNTHELGEVIDMIKDLSEAIYYCTTAEAMTDEVWKKEEEKMESKAPVTHK